MHDFAEMMFPLLAVSIPIVAILAAVLKRFLNYKERELELLGNRTAEKAAQYAARSERLEQRVAVLERILTDRSVHLGDEIERLRDRPVN